MFYTYVCACILYYLHSASHFLLLCSSVSIGRLFMSCASYLSLSHHFHVYMFPKSLRAHAAWRGFQNQRQTHATGSYLTDPVKADSRQRGSWNITPTPTDLLYTGKRVCTALQTLQLKGKLKTCCSLEKEIFGLAEDI